MPRPATGQVVERKTRSGITSFALRFRAYGERRYLTLGYSSEEWTRGRADEELSNILADVRRGIWRPPEDVAPEPAATVPTFHVFASEWLAAREQEGLRPRTIEFLRWCLVDHLLPVFADVALDEITAESIDRYARAKASEGELSNGSVNKTLAVLSRILEQAVEYEHITRNTAAGKRRRLRTTKPPRLFLEPAQVTALLDAASELDNEDRSRRRHRRALLATLAFAGLRVGELLALRWTDVNLATGKIRVRESKTTAGVRTIDVQPELHDELLSWKASTRHGEPTDFVFPTSTGRADNRNNVRRRVLLRAVERANERIGEGVECEPLPEKLAPHALRRTFASWLIAEGEDVSYVMDQMGHADSKMTMDVYSKALKSKRRRAQGRRTAEAPDPVLDARVNGHAMGTNAAGGLPEADEQRAA